MIRKNHLAVCKFLALLAVILPLAAGMALAAEKKPLMYDAYAGWRSIRFTQLSRDGAWLAYSLVAQEDDGELVVRNLRSDKEYRSPRGTQPAITADGKYVVFTVSPPQADVEKARKEKKKPAEQPKNGLGIMDLETGEVSTIDRVKNFKIAEDSGAFAAYLMEAPIKKPDEKKDAEEKATPRRKPAAKAEEAEKEGGKEEKKKEPGTELVIRNLATGEETKIPEVTEYLWNESGSWLAFAVSSETAEKDGAFAWHAATGNTVSLLEGLGHYKNLTFDEKGAQLAFVSDRDDYEADKPQFKLYYWKAPTAPAAELVPAAAKGFPEGMVVSEHGNLSFSKDGGRLFFGIARAPEPEPEDAPEPLKVDIWHWKDPHLQPMQKVRADRERRNSLMCVMHLGPKENKFVQLATEDVPQINLSDDGLLALGLSDLPYRQLISWDRGYNDVYLVSLSDGSKKKILEKSASRPMFSPGGKYVLFFEDGSDDWYTYRVSDGKTANLTEKLDVRFENELHDSPSEPRAYGSAGWTDGDKTVLIYDRYDIWEIDPDGTKAKMITQGKGRSDRMVYRYLRVDLERRAIPAKESVFLSVTDEKTKASGVYSVRLASGRAPAEVAMYDKLFGGLQKAKNADVFVFTLQRFEEYPNLWVSDAKFSNPKKISDANPQQTEYVWGKAELIDYINADGVTLQAILIKPEDFDPAKKYPLMVYIYERLSQGLHRYRQPGPGTSINVSRYVSNGYVVLQPDIIYEVGYPGPSSVKCVIPAVEKILEMGFIDPERVGIQGHSWGGYEISYMITQTNMFAAVQAGASVVNMTSAYGGIRWASGMSRAFQYEKTQSRIGAPLWERLPRYVENSPLFWVERVNTPYLTIHNDEDGAVPWYQGIEFFCALRRLGKEAYMFNYNGEAHGLRNRTNQKHWTVHQDEFFDHYLLGKPKPDWMKNGVPYLERGKRDIEPLFKKPGEERGEEKK